MSGLVSVFVEWSGSAPAVVWRAPGRINLMGEHLDYNGGHVLPFAVSQSVTVAARRRSGRRLRLRSTAYPGEVAVEATIEALGATTGWAAYPAGVMWALAERFEPFGADLLVDSDLPAGAGLSSSAALACATALALASLAGAGTDDDADRLGLAAAAQRAESAVAGAPVGMMDQTVSLLARAGHVLHLDTATGRYEHLPFDPLRAGLRLLAVDTGSSHALNDGAYARRRRACEAAAAALGVTHLASARADQLDAVPLGSGWAGVARHVVTEEARSVLVAADLRRGRFDRLGPALTASHRSMQHDFANSTPVMDAVVDAALGAGAAGARMTGGGWGGTAVVLVPAEAAAAVADAAASTVEAMTGRRPDVLEVEPSPGAHRLV